MELEKGPCLAPEASCICGHNRKSSDLDILIHPRITSGHWDD